MPIYEYHCEKCGHVFDEFQKLGEDNEKLKCPRCGSPRPIKLFSAFAATGMVNKSSSATSSSCSPSGFS